MVRAVTGIHQDWESHPQWLFGEHGLQSPPPNEMGGARGLHKLESIILLCWVAWLDCLPCVWSKQHIQHSHSKWDLAGSVLGWDAQPNAIYYNGCGAMLSPLLCSLSLWKVNVCPEEHKGIQAHMGCWSQERAEVFTHLIRFTSASTHAESWLAGLACKHNQQSQWIWSSSPPQAYETQINWWCHWWG